MESTDFSATCDDQARLVQDEDLSGLSPESALKDFLFVLSQENCRKLILPRFHPDGAYCPVCHQMIGERAKESFWAGKKIHCKSCGKWFSATTGTILNNTKLDYKAIYLLLVLPALGLDNREIAGIIGIHRDSVRNWRKRLNNAS